MFYCFFHVVISSIAVFKSHNNKVDALVSRQLKNQPASFYLITYHIQIKIIAEAYLIEAAIATDNLLRAKRIFLTDCSIRVTRLLNSYGLNKT